MYKSIGSNHVVALLMACLLACLAFSRAQGYTENVWQGSSGAAWATGSNWSLGHAPTASECAVLPDTGADYSIAVEGTQLVGAFQVAERSSDGIKTITLTGSGTISNETSVASHLVGANRRLVLNGASFYFDYNGENSEHGRISVKGEISVENAASTIHINAINFAGRGAGLYLSDGSVTIINLTYCNRNVVQIDGGAISIYRVSPSDTDSTAGPYDGFVTYRQNGGTSSNRINTFSPGSTLAIAGGSYVCRGDASFLDAATLSISGGTLEFRVDPAVDDCTTLSLAGGTILAAPLTTVTETYLRLMAASTGTVFSANVEAACALDFGDYAFLGRISNTKGAAYPVVRGRTVVLSGEYPFYVSGSGPNPYFFLEGPMTIRPAADTAAMGEREVYPFATGDITVDTRDWANPSLGRTVQLALGAKQEASLTVTGGGVLKLTPAKGKGTYPWDGARAFENVTVAAGATLEIPPVAPGNYGPLVAQCLTLASGATLKVTAGGSNGVYAAAWDIDPAARIEVTVDASFTSGATPVLVDLGSDAIADFTGQIVLSGATAGATLERVGGNIVVVKKTVTQPDGKYPHEWTGATSAKWSVAGNWFDNVATVSGQKQYCAFGAVDSRPASTFDLSAKSNFRQIIFRETAVRSFTVGGTGPATFKNVSDGYSGTTNASIYSASSVPQYVNLNSRTADDPNRFSLFAEAAGPIVFGGSLVMEGSNAKNGRLKICGDIRTTGTIKTKVIDFTARKTKPEMSRLFVESGSVTLTNQTLSLGIKNSGFRVAAGAVLTFETTSAAVYQWTNMPQKIIIDGTMSIACPVKGGGADQTYGGSGTLSISGTLTPAKGATAIGFSDALAVNLPSVWETVASSGVNTPLTLAGIGGRPVLHVADGWRYGAAAGVSTTTTAADRAAYIHAGATLAVDANGTATFADPVAGPGTLEVAGGTVKTPGGISSETTLAVASGATFEWDDETTVAGLVATNGATLRCTDQTKTLKVSGIANLSGAVIDGSAITFVPGHKTIKLFEAASVVGLPVVRGVRANVTVTPLATGGVAVNIENAQGLFLIFRGAAQQDSGTAFDLTLPGGGRCRLTSVGSGMWRFRKSADGSFPETGAVQALARWMDEDAPLPSLDFAVDETGEGWTLTAQDGTTARVAADGSAVAFYSDTGREVVRLTRFETGASQSVLGGTLAASEAVYGLGERLDRLNKRGQRVSLFTSDGYDDSTTTYTAVPLFSTTRGGGVFVNAYEPIVADMGATRANEWAMEIDKSAIDAYVIATDKMRDVPARYMALAGRPPAHDDWHFGSIICRQRPDFSLLDGPFAMRAYSYLSLGQGLRTIVDTYDGMGTLPSAVIAFGRDVDVYSASALATFAEGRDYLASKGIKYMVYFASGAVISQEAAGFKGEYLVNATIKDGAGNILLSRTKSIPDLRLSGDNPDISGNSTHQLLDITNPSAWAWYINSVWQPLLDNGVRGAMVDFCELMPDDGVVYDGVSVSYNWNDPSVFAGAAVHHAYPVFFAAKLQRDLDARLAAMDGSRFLIHARGGGIGAQRLTFLWAGDQKRAFAKLDDQLLAMLNSGVSGVPFMTYDMAGYQYTGARQTVVGVVNDATGVVDTSRTTPASGESAVYRRLSTDTSVETEQKIFARGVEFTAMSPCMRQNGYVRQAFEFDSATAAIYQTYDALHASMTNAIAAFAQTIGTTGVPMVRPLVCDYQDDANTWDIEDEYLFLDRYLVAPVLTDATSREVYLPEGTWRERGSGTVYEAPASGRRVTLSVPIDALPVFEKQ